MSESLWLSYEQCLLGEVFVEAAFMGIVFVLFLQCTSALLSSVNRTRGGINWWLVAHTIAMFLLSTTSFAMDQNKISKSLIDNRHILDRVNEELDNVGSTLVIFYLFRFSLIQWLSDGLLLYRCYIIYSMNNWIIVFPGLLYLASIAVGIGEICTSAGLKLTTTFDTYHLLDFAYFPVYVSLNTLLTVMIIAKLVWHSRQVRKAISSSGAPLGPYSFVVTIIVESYVVYALTLLLYILSRSAGNWRLLTISSSFPAPAQVIAPYLVTLRVANRRALTSEMVSSGSVGSMEFRSQGTTDGGGSLPDEDLTGSVEAHREIPNELQ